MGGYQDRIDSATCDTLLYLGDQLVKDDFALAAVSNRRPYLVSRVPASFKALLRKAFAEVNLLDDNALVLSSLNGDSPFDYPDNAKLYRAMLMVPTLQLIELEFERFTNINNSYRALQAPDVQVLN